MAPQSGAGCREVSLRSAISPSRTDQRRGAVIGAWRTCGRMTRMLRMSVGFRNCASAVPVMENRVCRQAMARFKHICAGGGK